MRIECLSISKYPASSGRPGDDVPLILPDRYYAVFDGATDVNGGLIGGVGTGRFAALQAAASVASSAFLTPPGALSATELVAAINSRLRQALWRESETLGRRIYAATTMVLMEEVGEVLRFMLVGDSGLRLNGAEVLQSLKPVDDITAAGRAVLYHLLLGRGSNPATVEAVCRRSVAHGFEAIVPEVISNAELEHLVAQARERLVDKLDAGLLEFVRPVLRSGIVRGQYPYANDATHPLGYAAVDGTTSRGFGLLAFERPRSTVRSVEMFTDGYLALPDAVTVQAWEAEAARIEREDPSKTERYLVAKGSTKDRQFDDRTVIVLTL